jgi:hypothetical protein
MVFRRLVIRSRPLGSGARCPDLSAEVCAIRKTSEHHRQIPFIPAIPTHRMILLILVSQLYPMIPFYRLRLSDILMIPNIGITPMSWTIPVIWAGQRPRVPRPEWEGLMSGIEATDAIGILAVFLGGMVLGVVLIVAAAIRREDRRLSLSGAAPDFMTRGARILMRVGSRGRRIWEW